MGRDAEDKEVMEILRQNYAGAFPAMRKIIDYVMRYPQEVLDFNVSELAKACGTSDASVVRACHALGYEGYNRFRLALARDLGKKQQIVKNNGGNKDFVKSMFSDLSESLLNVAANLDKTAVKKCVSLIKKTSCVHVIAEGNSANLSQYLGFRLERIGIRSTYYAEPVYFLNQLNFADKEDILIAISKSGESERTLEGIRLGKEKGLKVILISSAMLSRASQLADYLLLSNDKSDRQYFKDYSYLNEMAVIEALLHFIVNKEHVY